jgi:predicted Rossmann fold flavoprotein
MTSKQTIIIGAGPAGLFAAALIASRQERVLVLEKQPDPGRKLLLTGSGQCNFTHAGPIRDFLDAYGGHGAWLKPALLHFTNQDIVAWLGRRGVKAMTVPGTGKVFPASRRARDVLDALVSAGREQGAEVLTRRPVDRVLRSGTGGFTVGAGGEEYRARNVVIATGGASYPATGSTGDGWGLARSLGHTLVPPRPGLAPFKVKDHPLADLTGVSFKDLNVGLWRKGRQLAARSGDLVITHFGISGPVVHNLARAAAPGDTAKLAFVPAVTEREWLDGLERSGKLRIKAWLKARSLPEALVLAILRLAQVSPETAAARLSRGRRLELMRLATAFPLEIGSVGDWNSAMVTCGGVALDEVDPGTMGSRLVPGLYFAGEVLDVDGDSGGYDLQAAWSTAALAARAILGKRTGKNVALGAGGRGKNGQTGRA